MSQSAALRGPPWVHSGGRTLACGSLRKRFVLAPDRPSRRPARYQRAQTGGIGVHALELRVIDLRSGRPVRSARADRQLALHRRWIPLSLLRRWSMRRHSRRPPGQCVGGQEGPAGAAAAWTGRDRSDRRRGRRYPAAGAIRRRPRQPDQHGRLERVRPPPASVNERVRAALALVTRCGDPVFAGGATTGPGRGASA